MLVQLLCPVGHINGGAPFECPDAEPTDEWLNTVSRRLWESAKRHPEQWKKCGLCAEPFSDRWTVGTSRTRWRTLDDAINALARSDGKLVEDGV